MLPDAPAPSSYWSQDDLRSLAAHKGVIAQMVLDFQPLSVVTNKGFIINQRQVYWDVIVRSWIIILRLTMPHLQLHSPSWYKDKIQKV